LQKSEVSIESTAHVHLEKKAIRALGVAESFRESEGRSTLAAVVMRSDLVVDGFAFGSLTVSGSDATLEIVSLVSKLKRNDVNAIFLSGSVLSLYNIVDVDKASEDLDLPVVALTFRESSANLAENIRSRFDTKTARSKIELLEKLGTPKKVALKTGYSVFVRSAGISDAETRRLLDRFLLQGSIPEPVRVARLLAKNVAALLREVRR